MKLRANQEEPKLILPGELAPELDDLYTSYVTELYENAELPSAIDLIKMFRFCPINRIAVEFKSLRASAAFGEYSHPDKMPIRTSSGRQTLTEWMRSNFKTMHGNLPDVVGKMFRQAYGLGHAVAEIVYSANIPGHQGEWRLWKLKVLNPCRYRFAGIYGDWDRIIYRSTYRSHYPIPRRKLLHIYIPSIEDPENPLGDGQGVRGYNYYLARKLALKNWNNQLAKGVKGQTIVKADSNATVPLTNARGENLIDSKGNPIPINAVKAAGEKFAQAKDGDVVAIDKSTEVQHFPGIAGTGADYNLALTRYTDDILMAYGIPKTILGEGSGALGQAGLNAGHRLTLDTQIESMVNICREQFIEQIARDLLSANFGISQQDDYGSFDVNKQLPPEQAGMRITNLMSAMLQGIVSPQDLEAVNRIREDVGLSRLSVEDFQQMQIQQILQQQQQTSYEAENNVE
ncbi:MAG: hypothetical protein QNJ72_31390 [Pleurocapsa sp. MO_226.B13]|nr:hypothetical protein [Pleurocapsa sp. MO_226.B13]